MRRWEMACALMSGKRTMEHICRVCGQSMLGAVRSRARAIEDCQAERTPSRPALRLVPKAPEPKPPRVPNVSEHAKLRFAQYLYGIDPVELERAIMTETVRMGILAGANFITRSDGLRLPIAPDGTIVTVLPKREDKRMYMKGRVVRVPEVDLRRALAEQFYEELFSS